MLNVEDSDVSQCEDGWLPVTIGETLSVMSIGFLMTNKNEAVVWRGPKKNAMIKQVWSLSSFELSCQLLKNDLNQLWSVS